VIRERMQSEAAPRIPAVTAHLVEAGGKRLRPMLVLAAARLLGYGGVHHVDLAVAVEFIHTATLLHDDVVDDSKQRRGRPTANLLWDNMSSVLVGDFLFARSFQLMVETGNLRVLGSWRTPRPRSRKGRCCSSRRRATCSPRRTPICG
jgi:octaprenyl-diphosphate synthase